MTLTFTQNVCAVLIGVAVCSSCSRPVAYFQRGASSSFATPKSQPLVIATSEQAAATPIKARMPVEAAPVPIEAHLPNEAKLATATKLNERMRRVTQLLITPTTPNSKTNKPTKPIVPFNWRPLPIKSSTSPPSSSTRPPIKKARLTTRAFCGFLGAPC